MICDSRGYTNSDPLIWHIEQLHLVTGISVRGGLSLTVYEMTPQWQPPSYVSYLGRGLPVVGETGVSSDIA